jgi:hypothetical protein
MDHRKKVMILDGATDLYTLIRDILGMTRDDERVAQLDQATERWRTGTNRSFISSKGWAEMDDQSAEKPSRKEWARQQRRAAYLRAKEFRASDPKQLAFREAMKERRREANAAGKEQRKAAAKEQKARRAERQASQRAAQDQQLLMIVKPATKG